VNTLLPIHYWRHKGERREESGGGKKRGEGARTKNFLHWGREKGLATREGEEGEGEEGRYSPLFVSSACSERS